PRPPPPLSRGSPGPPARFPPGAPRPHRDEGRLRSRAVRGLHRARQQAAGERVPDPRGEPRRRSGDDGRGAREPRRPAASRAGSVPGARRLPVRLLHAGATVLRGGAARRERPGRAQRGDARPRPDGGHRAHRRRDSRAHERQPLPLRRLPKHRRRRAGGGARSLRARAPAVKPFAYAQVPDVRAALSAAGQGTTVRFLAGGTNLIDLMKQGVEEPDQVVDVSRLPLAEIEEDERGGVVIGALARNPQVSAHPLTRQRYPVLAEALLSGASPQLRNMATVGGNLLQRTRCPYFTDPAFAECNRRRPGSGCAARHGYTRMHAILGASDECIATHPSDMAVALAALDAVVEVTGPDGDRSIATGGLRPLPGDTPPVEPELRAAEPIGAVPLPASPFERRSHYLKV